MRKHTHICRRRRRRFSALARPDELCIPCREAREHLSGLHEKKRSPRCVKCYGRGAK